jgi:cell wall-associated NlpC family hydrolase
VPRCGKGPGAGRGTSARGRGILSTRSEASKLRDVIEPDSNPVEWGRHYPGSFPATPATFAWQKVCAATVAVALILLLDGCGHEAVRSKARAGVQPRTWQTLPPADPAAANAVLMRALGLVGTPYRYGGNTPEGGFDCSGLVNYVYRDMLDLRLPRTSRELAAWQGPRIPLDRLVAADLVFFGTGGEVSHVGIYVGEGRFVHAPSTGGTVRLDRLDGPYWRDHYSGAVRILH